MCSQALTSRQKITSLEILWLTPFSGSSVSGLSSLGGSSLQAFKSQSVSQKIFPALLEQGMPGSFFEINKNYLRNGSLQKTASNPLWYNPFNLLFHSFISAIAYIWEVPNIWTFWGSQSQSQSPDNQEHSNHGLSPSPP